MRNLYLLLFIIAAPLLAVSQLPIQEVHNDVDYSQILKNWDLYETKEFEDVKIFRMQGENGINHRTNLLYLSSFCENDGIYGKLAIFSDRNSKQMADPSLLTVEIIDTETDELYLQYELKGEPKHFKRDIWYNYYTLPIPEKVNKRFTVKVVDEGLDRTFIFFVFGLPEKCYAENAKFQESTIEDPVLERKPSFKIN